MKAKEIIYNLKNLKAQGKTSDETEISDFQYLFIIDYYRAMLIRQQQAKGQTINPYIKQSFNIVLIKNSCNAISSIALPKPIELHNYEMITRVADGYNQRTTVHSNDWLEFSKYTSGECTWYIKDDKLYLNNYYGPLKTTIEGVWERPYEVEVIKGTINDLDPMDFEYPITSTMLDQLYKLAVDSEMKLSMIVPKDTLNNSDEGSQQ